MTKRSPSIFLFLLTGMLRSTVVLSQVTRSDGDLGFCFYPECVEVECCSSGTTWDSTTGVCVVGSPAFNGTYPVGYVHECKRQLCYEGNCCGPGTDYVGGVCLAGSPGTLQEPPRAQFGFTLKLPEACPVPSEETTETLLDIFIEVYNELAEPYCFSVVLEPVEAAAIPTTMSPSAAPITNAPSASPTKASFTPSSSPSFTGATIPPVRGVQPEPPDFRVNVNYLANIRDGCRFCGSDRPCFAGGCRRRRSLRNLQDAGENSTFPNLLPDGTCSLSGGPDQFDVIINYSAAIRNSTDLPNDPDCPYSVEEITVSDRGSISGSVTEDTNDDNTGDIPLSGTQIDLLDMTGTILATTLTDTMGNYLFNYLPLGDYAVMQMDGDSYVSVSDVDGSNDNTISVTVGGSGVFDLTRNDFVDRLLSP